MISKVLEVLIYGLLWARMSTAERYREVFKRAVDRSANTFETVHNYKIGVSDPERDTSHADGYEYGSRSG